MSEQHIIMDLMGIPIPLRVAYHFDSIPEMMKFKERIDAVYKDGELAFCEDCERIEPEDFEPDRNEGYD